MDQFPKEGVSVDRNHPITLKIGNSGHKNKLVITQGSMPNLVGLTLREAMQRAAKEGVGIKIKGSGIVRSQSVLPGSRIIKGSFCYLEASL